jgi:GAF domain-containing protein
MATPVLMSEQAALRRVATLVAHGTPPEQLFSAVIEEVGQLLEVEYAYMGRYEPDGMIAFIASWGPLGPPFRTGGRERIGGSNLVTRVFETGGSARTDSLADASGPLGVAARDLGVRSAVGTPILVEGALWGVVIAGSTLEQPLPADTETRLGPAGSEGPGARPRG